MILNYVLENANAPGTNLVVTLSGPPADRLAWRSAYADGAPAFYFIDDGGQAEWGIGTVRWGTPNTFSRDGVIGNTVGNTNRLNFTGAVQVYNEIPGQRLPYIHSQVIWAPGAYLDPHSGGVPIGSGMDFWGSVAPAGWVWANGQALSRTTYGNLFAVLSTAYGAGDGFNTFNVPNKSGRVSVSRETMGGVPSTNVISTVPFGGTGLGTWVGHQSLQAHQHPITDQRHNHVLHDQGHFHHYFHSWLYPGTSVQSGPGFDISDTALGTDSNGLYSSNISIDQSWSNINHTENIGFGDGQNMQPGIVCNYIIYAGYV